MRMCRVLMAVVVGMLALPVVGRAASPLAPYVDEQTVLAGRLDVSKVDTKGIEAFVHSIMEKQGADAQDFQQLTMARLAADATLERFKALGGERVYVLISFPDLWPAMDPLAMLIPIHAGGDIKGMGAMFKAFPLGQATGREVAVEELSDQMLYVGSPVALKRLRSLHAAARPELTEEVEGSAAMNVAVSPTEDMRRVVSEMMPRLPAMVGGGATAEIMDDLSGVTLEVNFPPAAEVTLTARTGKSESAARGLADAAGHGVDYLKRQPEYQKVTEKDGPLEGHGEKLNALVESFKPVAKVGSDGVAEARVHLGTADVEEMVVTLSPGVARAKVTAARARSMSNLKQLAVACIMYKSDSKGAWPGSTDDLKAYINGDGVFVSPSDPQHRAYVLEPWTAEEIKSLDKMASETPIIYEAGDDRGGGFSVAYLDGHVDFMMKRSVLAGYLAKAHAEADMKK